jgi:hypothetical protein
MIIIHNSSCVKSGKWALSPLSAFPIRSHTLAERENSTRVILITPVWRWDTAAALALITRRRWGGRRMKIRARSHRGKIMTACRITGHAKQNNFWIQLMLSPRRERWVLHNAAVRIHIMWCRLSQQRLFKATRESAWPILGKYFVSKDNKKWLRQWTEERHLSHKFTQDVQNYWSNILCEDVKYTFKIYLCM